MAELPELSFHKMTSAEEAGAGYDIIVDIEPCAIPDEAAEWNGVLFRTSKQGWGWYARSVAKNEKIGWREIGVADAQVDATDDALSAVRRHLEN